ncbi:hypothetical protein H6F90_25725 [Trichocoleus sp. FACHB-591]|uniref:hypothetical protein n=1 Tax=Trichocoleus sp. FACHB-591 TaxID=2692872 RepID=UPI001688B6F0|nr:hypothetical protein [Trichocoleus sp. FACHB-591]MBD2098475.1 hypothetical protein [Trichocoleus sp. FACHB-591]
MSELTIRCKLPECDRCIFYAHTPFLVCTLHPGGVSSNSCLDFQRDPMAKPEELWEPEGASYYNGELVVTPQQRWSRLEKLALLDTHPLFTGRCPQCEISIPYEDLKVHWDCPLCDWKDDSI